MIMNARHAMCAGIPAVVILLAASAPPVPDLPDLGVAEPQVRVVIRKAHDELRRSPRAATQWGHYGSVLDAHSFAAEAIQAYEVAGVLDPDDFRWPYLTAILVSQDDPVATLTYLQDALDRNDDYAPLYVRYAAMMEAMGRLEAAGAAYERAVALEDGDPYAHAGLGRCLLADGDADRAKDHLNHAIELDDQCRPALSAMAAYARRTGDMTAARQWSQRASRSPKPSPRDKVLADVRRLGVSTTEIVRRANDQLAADLPDAARKTLQWLVEQNPASVRGRKRLGDFHLAANDTTAAMQQYRAALSVDARFVPARLGLAHVLTRVNRLEDAQREYEKVLGGHPSSVPAHRGLAICMAAQGRMEPAAEHFARVIELAPDDRRARLACGSALLAIGQYRRAADVLEVMVTGNPPDDELTPGARYALAGALSGLAQMHAAEGKSDTTESLLGRAVTLVAVTPGGRAELALQYARAASELAQGGLPAAAIGLLRHGLTRLPESARINNELAWLLATTPDADLRDGAQAVKFAERAVELTGGDSCNELDTLAAAYAEAGRLDEAITTAERALAIATRTGPAELVTQLAERLEQLRARRRSP